MGPALEPSVAESSPWLPARRVALVAALVAVAAVDAIVGSRWFGETRPALAADTVVIAAVTVAVIDPRRLRDLASLTAAATSVTVSWGVDRVEPADWSLMMGHGAWPGFAELAGLGILTAWSLRSSRAVLAAMAWLGLGAALGALVGWRQDGRYTVLLSLVLGAAWLGTGIAGLYLRYLDHREVVRARQARQDERLAVARELHDLVAHHVTGIVLQAQAAKLVAGERPEAAARAMDTIEQAGANALGAMRQLVGALREESSEAELSPTATLDDLRALAGPSGRGEPPVRLAIDERAATIPGEVMASVHRIARESVTNARRHARGATAIDVAVRCADGSVTLQVSNDGPPVARRGSGGFGLRGMAERVAALGGRFSAGPLPAGGWQVVAELPIRAGHA